MLKSLFYFFVIVILFSACNNPETKNDVIGKIIEANEKYSSIHYKVDEKYYYSDGIDTIATPYEIWAIKDNTDSLKQGYIWVDNNYRPYNMIYRNGDMYLAIPPKNTGILYKDFKENMISPVDWIDIFLNPEIFKNIMEDTMNRVVVKDTLYEEKKCLFVQIVFPPENDKTQIHNYIFEKKLYVPLWSMLKIKSQKNTYFDELSFSEYSFDNIDIKELEDRYKQVLKHNPVERGGKNSIAARIESMLHAGDKAPGIEGRFYDTGEKFELNDYTGNNIIVIDFWYTHCPPCVKAMPALNDLYNKYKDKGLKIFGLNSVDNQSRSEDVLKKFLGKRKIDYDVILIDPQVDKDYKINGYPSIYLIDKAGKISYVELGYEEDKFELFKQKVKELIE